MKKLKSLKLMLLAAVALCSSNAFGADQYVIQNGALQGGATSTTLEYTPSPYELKYTIKNLAFKSNTWASAEVAVAEVEVSQGSAFSNSTATVAPANTIEWEVNFTISGTSYKRVVTFNVTDIVANAFKNKSAVTTVTLPANVVNIGESAFEGTKATSVTISANATIGNNAFKNTKLSTLTLGDWATIGNSAFEGTELTSVALGKFTSIGTDAFKNSAALATVTFTQPGEAGTGTPAIPQQTIAAGAFAGTIISDLDLTNTNLQTVNRLFEEYNADLTKVTFPATLTTIAANAFEKCVKLATLDFDLATELTTIGNYAFGTTPKLTTVNLAKAEKLVYFTSDGLVKSGSNAYTTPFISDGGTNSALTTVTLPLKSNKSVTKDLGTAFAKCAKLATLSNVGALTLVAAKAFDGDAALTEISLPATVEDIAANALDGSAFTKVTIACSATNGKPTIAATGNEETLKTVIFTGEFKGDITAANGFTGLTKVQFGAFNGAIAAGGIVLATGADATVIFGEMKKDFANDNPITGPTAAGKKANLTLGTISANLAHATIISNNVDYVQIGQVASGKTFNLAAVGAADSLSVTGNVVGTIADFGADNTTLTKIEFNDVVMAADKITGWTHVKGLKKVYWSPADNKATKALATDAFAASAAADFASCTITFVTSTKVATLYGADFATKQYINNVKISAAAVSAETKKIDVAAPSGFKYFYGKMRESAAYTVPAKVGDVEIMVYSAYVDKDAENVSTIYMDPLQVIDGKYYVPANQAVVVKSTSSAQVTITSYAGTKSSMRYASDASIVNDIKYEASKKVGQEYFDNYAGKTIYAMAKTATYGLNWKTFGADVVMPEKTFYVVTDTPVGGAAAPELNIVWLDGSEDNYTTGIESVKATKQNNDVIYNLAGQKVGADYKGVVIKNGKKFVQK